MEKVLFRFYSDIFEKEKVETIWAEEIDKEKGIYKIENIPFYVPFISSSDLVLAQYDKVEQSLVYKSTYKHSGNSTIQVVIMNKEYKTNDIRKIFNELNCDSEKFSEGYFSMEIPSVISYKKIKTKLEELENNGIIDYAEPNLSEKHFNEI
ncbi:DUF4265 domain-containing protein [Flavobacterium psychrophilum]|uniref:DUF4265 domain-containing protein n=1 Tax=Flavobacterium psychrophilum TaxID=96345 RepID=UPI000B7C4ACD|nr:DUF4265 domain-containing protein [Flavobacterium psychrophilum]MEB3380630.1 DUF4265 domain-containing protein [Flavobacterium psychrophilum]SNA71226.1 conserved hypothetical protein [Flavobacterium psychrophilum]